MSGFFYDDSAQKGAMRQTQQGLRTQQFEGKRARQDIADALPSEMAATTAGVNRALWIIFGIMAAIVIRMLMMHADKIQ